MIETYTEDEIVSVSHLKEIPVGSHIVGVDTFFSAIKTDLDEWSFNDRIDVMHHRSSKFIADIFEGTEFELYVKEG